MTERQAQLVRMDAAWRERNREHLTHALDQSRDPVDRQLALHAHVQGEIDRLTEKEYLMRSGQWPSEETESSSVA